MARTTQGLASWYTSKDVRIQAWSQQHFKTMSDYIRSFERVVIASHETTLEELRQNFLKLLPLYMYGRYGDFTWQEAESDTSQTSVSWQHTVIHYLLRAITIMFPLLLMGIYLWQPTLFPFITLNKDIVSIIFVAWLLLTIDGGLKLGIISSVTKLAKEIKDLG